MTGLRRTKVWLVERCIVNETNLVRKKLHQKEKDSLYYDRDQYGSDVMSLVAREERVYINCCELRQWKHMLILIVLLLPQNVGAYIH